MEEKWKQWQTLFSWAPKSLWMVTTAMKLKDSCSLEEKLWQTECALVTQSCLTLCNPMDCSLPVSSVHGILQARILEGVTIIFSRGSSWPRDRTQVSCIAGRFFAVWATKEAPKCESVSHSVMSNCDPMDCSLPGFSVQGFSSQEYWSKKPFTSLENLSNPRISCTVGRFFTV